MNVEAPDSASKVLKLALESSLPSSVLVYHGREYPSSFLGRDLSLWLSKADKVTHALVLSALGIQDRVQNMGVQLLEQIGTFFQRCVDLRLLSGVNHEERQFHSDVFYVVEEARIKPQELDRALLDQIEFLKKNVEVRDRRYRLRSYMAFLASEARGCLGEKGPGFQVLLDAGLVECICEPDFFQFVPRLVHSGYVFVTQSAGSAGFTRKWVVLREKSLLFYHENRRQLQFEVELTLAWAEALDHHSNLSALDGIGGLGSSSNNLMTHNNEPSSPQWLIVTPTQRITCLTTSPVEQQTWLQLIVALTTVVSEENQIIEQAEAIIVSTSFFINSGE